MYLDRVGSTTIEHAAYTGSIVITASVVGVMKMENCNTYNFIHTGLTYT